jgi:PIN domain nuclease of toxin-antitoxin system
MADGSHLVFVNAAVIWEIRIKQALGKLKIPCDPFDRRLVAQARVEGFTVATRDAVFRKYKIPLMLT